MEIRLDAVEGSLPPKETFIALRVGDVQKQSRYSASRTYRFPDPGDARSGAGRVEVFQRIGHLTVNFENREGQLQDIEVPIDSPDTTRLQMRLAVKGGAAEVSGKKTKAKSRLDAAQRYVDEHKLEEILADAMREVIHDKPSDPLTFLSNQIMKHAASRIPLPAADISGRKNNGLKLPPLDTGETKEKTAKDLPQDALQLIAGFDKALAENMACKEAEKVEEVLPEEEHLVAVDKVKRIVEEPKQEFSGSFAERRLQKLLNAAQDGPERMAAVVNEKDHPNQLGAHMRLYQVATQEPGHPPHHVTHDVSSNGEASKPRASPDREVDELRKQESVDTATAPALQKPVASTPIDNIEDIRAQAREGLLRSAADGSLSMVLSKAQSAATATTDKAEKAKRFKLSPSVGTWLQTKPPKVEDVSPVMVDKVDSAATTVKAEKAKRFKLSPSVGTWLQTKPPKVEDVSPVMVDNASKVDKVKHVSPVMVDKVDNAAKTDKAEKAKRFKLSPSVGTWLQKKPPKVDDDRPATVNQGHDMLMTLDSEALISTFEKELHRKDEEIKRLRQQAGE